MDWLYFTKFSIHGITQLLMALMITGYLFFVPQKSKATWWLVLFFAGFLLTTVAHFLLVSVYVPWRSFFGFSQAIGGSVSLLALIQFAYWFGGNRHVRESKIVLGIAICLTLAHGIGADPELFAQTDILFFAGLVLMGEVVWPIVVFFRKLLLFAEDASTRSVWARVRRPGNRQARALRSFMLLSMSWLLLSSTAVLESLGYLSVETLLMTLVSVYLLFMFGFVLVYANNAPESTSLKVKFVGIALVVQLLVMGDMGAFMLMDYERRYQAACLVEVSASRKALIENNHDAVPSDIFLINSYELDGDMAKKNIFRRAYQSEKAIHEQYVPNEFTPQVIGLMQQNSLISPNEARDQLLQGFNRSDVVHMQLEYGFHGLVADLNYAVFYFTLGGTLFEVHYPFERYMDAVHSFCVKVIGFIAGTTFFMVILFPLFLRSGLDRPLKDLLAGVRKVNEGDLSARVVVHVDDEIGFVARSFNNMVASVDDADQKLKAYAQDLEVRVQERTRDLSEKNEELERILDELQSAHKHLIFQEKMASVGQLVAGVAHEINNPIGAVQSSADVSARCVEKIVSEVEEVDAIETLRTSHSFGQSTDILTKNTGVIQEACDRVSRLVNSLKNFSRVDEAVFQMADLHEGVESSLVLLQMAEQIEVVKEYGTVDLVYCAPGQINQVIYNVLKNAASAIEGNGQIGIRTYQDGDEAHIAIRDNGRGIAPELLEHIFEFRFTASDTRVKMGSGLASAYDIVAQHGGDIKIESEVNQGTEVFIRLPVRRDLKS